MLENRLGQFQTGPVCRLNQNGEERLKSSSVFIQSRSKEKQFLIFENPKGL